jgi:hypothetical protein
MRIGFIVGKDDEIYLGEDGLYDITPNKYIQNGELHTDVAIAMTIKKSYPDITVDIILPKDISVERLKKNAVNFILGYDCINQLSNEPYIRKFAGPSGYNKLRAIYANKNSKVFPPIEFLDFIWSKDKYLDAFNKKKIPITPTITVSTFNISKIIQSIQKRGWESFIIKPVGGTVAIGVKMFKLTECLKDPLIIKEYFDTNKISYDKFLIQELITGFRKHGEIKMFWINGEYSYAVNTVDRGPDNYTVKFVKDKKILEECKNIGAMVVGALPDIKVGNTKIKPAMVRTDFTCCLENKKHIPTNYFLNEVEHQDAGSYVNNENIKYPYVQVMADTYVKKAHELVSAGF